MQLALYRAERPEVFDDIIGQKQIVKILQNQIKNGTVSQAYLFTGTHGTGKTSTARILAKAVNCIGEVAVAGRTDGKIPCGECENCKAIKEGRFVDVIELDAASNNGVDDLRAIIDLVKYPPTIGKYKVYIIDEVHMLTPAAENAFLKTLEEPPEYAIFILATTDPQKVRATIRSRCMQLNFKRVSEEELVQGMERICRTRGVEVTRDALGTISAKADGSVRDALSILEQCMAAGDEYIDKDLVLEYTGSAGEDFYLSLTDNVTSGRLGDALMDIDEVVKEGKDSKQLLKDWLEHYRNLMIAKYVDRAGRIISASEENLERIKAQADSIDIKEIERGIRLMSEYINLGRYSDRPRILLESLAVRLAGSDDAVSVTSTPRKTTGAMMRSTHNPAQRSASRSADTTMSADRGVSRADGTSAFEDRGAASGAQATSNEQPHQANATHNDIDEPVMRFEAPKQSASDLEADMQLARATSPNAGAEDMWDRICAEMVKHQRSFGPIAKSTQGKSFENDELLVVARKNRLPMVEMASGDIDRIAKAMYGSRVYVRFIAGEIEDNRGAVKVQQAMNDELDMPEQEPEYVDMNPSELEYLESNQPDGDNSIEDLSLSLEATLGMKIDVVD